MVASTALAARSGWSVWPGMPGQFAPEWGGQFDAESLVTFRRNWVVNISGISSLKDLSKEYNADIFYTCLYTDDIMYMFNLRKLTLMDVSLTTINAPKISMQDHYNKIPKLMIELPFALGTRYKLKK